MYSQPYKRYVTAVLLTVYIFNQTDRAVFGFLMEPIKRELALSDSQLGFLAGPALVLFYATLGVPIARLADRSSRVNIISVAVALWSIIVVSSAFVGKFWHFALARIGVGVGEAGFSAVAQSLLADYHSPAERTRAMSIFMLGIPLGGLVSNLLGGWANEAYGWRTAFVLAGAPGILLALLVKFTIREPARSHLAVATGAITSAAATREAAASGVSAEPPLRQVWAMLWRRRALRHIAIAISLVNLVTACMMTWLPAFFVRIHGMPTGELGAWLAVAVSAGGGLGTWLGGYSGGRRGESRPRAQVQRLAISAALITPILLTILIGPSRKLGLLLLLPAYILMFYSLGPSFSLVQSLTPARSRATVTATVILAQAVLAGVVGLQLVGVISDALVAAYGAASLRWALASVTLVALWGAVHFALSGRTVVEDVMEAERRDE
jgi:MFS family permease